MRPGDIVLMRFPHEDLSVGKLRPSLVIAIDPGYKKDILLAMLTSRLYQARSGFDEVINEDDLDYSQTGLKASSVVRLARLVTVASTVPTAKLGSIGTKRLHRINQRLAEWISASALSL